MTCTSESLREAGVPTTFLTTKTKTSIGTWNIRSLYETGRIAQVCEESTRYCSEGSVSQTEIAKAIKSLKSGKAAGPEGTLPEAPKADIQTPTDVLTQSYARSGKESKFQQTRGKICDGKLTEPVNAQTGVRQGCLLSPAIFLMVVAWVMRQSTTGRRSWNLMKQLEDLDFADDINLPSQKQQDVQEKLYSEGEDSEKTGLQINIRKTEAMRMNIKQANALGLHDEIIEEVDKFVYLGSVVRKNGGTDEDIKCRINKARYAFNTLKPI
ncbi:hypothetical protein EGW08_015991 [Elysia chlorotica]|uniref:Reverse transcriptase domain-containing protein n=1 Tax=Elysia chlorotica TaxID=188477 RepID=A0A3S0ZF94_ELYCH|nr:hypothetical protein EGW08_015991 [Elysia chlorotica]